MLDNEQIVEMNENVMKCFPEGKIVLLDGRVVDCYPRAGLAFGESVGQPIDSKPVKTDKEIEADMVRFIKNAFFFLANKEALSSVLGGLIERLAEFKSALDAQDALRLRDLLEKGRMVIESMPPTYKSIARR